MHDHTRKPLAHIFIDGQNLAYAVRDAFFYRQINYDIFTLAQAACHLKGWDLGRISFYTGMPSRDLAPDLHHFWRRKLSLMHKQGIETVTLPLKYHATVELRHDGSAKTVHHAREKGIDVRIAVDIIAAAHEPQCDAILLFSQDADLAEALSGAARVACAARRPLLMACAFPTGDNPRSKRGINGVDWVPIDKAVYDACIDRHDYSFSPHRGDAETEIRLDRAAQALDASRVSMPALRPG